MSVDSARRVSPRRARELVLSWFESRRTASVSLKEVSNPEVDPSDGYVVAYEARFLPADLSRASVETWITDDGHVAFGFERRHRVAERLGVKVGRDFFATGIEPVPMSEEELTTLLQLSADGEIRLRVLKLPWVGIVSMTAFVPAGTKELCGLSGPSFRWLNELSPNGSRFGDVIEYEPW